jgi:beta-mannosidase
MEARPRTNVRVAVLPVGIVTPAEKATEMIVATCGDGRATWYFAPDRELDYPTPPPQATLERNEHGWRLTLRTQTLLRDVVINIDRIDTQATISDNVVTILPGESFTWEIRTELALSVEQLISPPVFQCANRFGRRNAATSPRA